MKQTVLITGASGGIGSAIAERFALAGHRVAIHYRSHRAEAEALCQRLKGRQLSAMTFYADVGRESDVEELVSGLHAAYGRIDVLINNAGVALPQTPVQDVRAEDWDRLFSVNVRGMYLMTRAVLPDMIERKSGAIVNVSSMWGVTGGSCEAAYSASKAAVIGLTKALAKELAPSGIRVNCIAPGFIDTAMNAALSPCERADFLADTPLERAGTPQDVAAAAAFLASGEADYITGQTLCVDGGRCI